MHLIHRISALALLPLLLFLVTGCDQETETPIRSSIRDEKSKPPVEKPPEELLSSQAAFIEVSAKVTPAVVNIRAARMRSQDSLGPLFEEFFGDLFRNHPPVQPRREQSLGSGFLISDDGYILTNNHVVKDAEDIQVKLSDQRVYNGKVVGVDDRTDLAVIKIETEDKLPTVVLGDSDKLQVGQWSLAIGNPFGLDRTLTVGVISAIGRAGLGIEDYENFIQTDASINPGNSGGPLLNIYGEVVGINTAIVASGQGIGFAIPVNMAKVIAKQLIESGEVSRGWLGVSIQPLSPELAESFGLNRPTGALVNQVVPGSPAEKAGVQRGDILLEFAGKEVRSVQDLQLMVANTPAGNEVEMTVLRNGERMTLPVKISAMGPETMTQPPPAERGKTQAFGMSVMPTEGEGVQVEEVDPSSSAAAAGVRSGDIILSINHMETPDLKAFRDVAEKAKKEGRNIVLLLQRGEATLYLAFPVE